MWPFRKKKPDPKKTFRYWDGHKWRYADPLEVWSMLDKGTEQDGGALALLKAVAAKDPPPGTTGDMLKLYRAKQFKAADTLSLVAGAVFGLPAFNTASGEGLTRADRVALVGGFLDYLGGLAAASRPLASSSPQPVVSPSA